jgi:phosphoserine aminotransferase
MFLEKNEVAVDILNHSLSVPALRIWIGPVIEMENIRRLLSWIEIAYAEMSNCIE